MTPQRRRALSGGGVALLAAGLAALSAPAYAEGHPSGAPSFHQATTKEHGPFDGRGGNGPHGHHRPPNDDNGGPESGCYSIDSWIAGEKQFLGVVSDGEIFVGARGVQPEPDLVDWENITTLDDSTVANACDVTVAVQDEVLYVEAINTDGLVYETTCDISDGLDPELDCNGSWELIEPQPE